MNIFPRFSIGRVLNIFELVLDIRSPCNFSFIDLNLDTLVILENVGIVEHALGYETAWNSWIGVLKLDLLSIMLLVVPEISNENDRIAVTELVCLDVVSVQLRAISRLDISSVVLVEVVQLIVDVDWALNIIWDFLEVNWALSFLNLRVVLRLEIFLADLIVLRTTLENLLTKYVKYDTDGQEYNTEDAEGEHGAHCGGHWSPSGQGLLLELGLLKFLDLVPDPLLFFLIDVHIYFLINYKPNVV